MPTEPRHTRTITPEAAAHWEALDGLPAAEVVHDDVLLPNGPGLIDPFPVSLHVPARMRRLRCDTCETVERPTGIAEPDPLELVHEPGCFLADVEASQYAADMERLQRLVANGHPARFHRHPTETERALLDSCGLAPITQFVGVHLTAAGGRRRALRWLTDREPALSAG
ncbi:hypothetical protein [Quadrisphaera sp. INWT6]|uniref:hypothetical protein n=1 Tax=Quadrisphaera sp. INWT6 TaxID=2596917 RepID=UPI001892207A|nr:hypothetical protein [Quadrisphaera sp. INWT6]MBF5081386.1 hypothetical protein [Quadrisphaera sp. INWT6]